eukprot:COSAG06_NODE_45318_length_355_cov_13.000000_1_plen_118_part_11
MTSFLNDQQDKFVSLLREERETSERRSDCQRHDMETKLDQQRHETQQVRHDMETTLDKQQHDMETKLDEQRRETQQVRHEMETKLDEQRQETCKQQVREVASAMSCVSEAQMELLQTR